MKIPMNCILCGFEFKQAVPGDINQPAQGVEFISYGHYGSTRFDPMDGSFLALNICDVCLGDAIQVGRVVQGEHEQPRIKGKIKYRKPG